MKSSWTEIRTVRSLTSYHHGQNRLAFEKINLIDCQLNTELDSEKQN